ncbi:MAG: permease [Candidatus Zapsychrus exili]|nr:permease [Candidatus Zapsychrus exili]
MLTGFVDWFIYGILGFDIESQLGGTIHFFIYDSLKIGLLLFFMIAVIGFLRSYLSEARIKRWMTNAGIVKYFYAALFGAFTPFCSCSSIPIFLSFLKTGIPMGVMFSFLITSPLLNEYLAVLMFGFFGWKIAVAYIFSGMFIGIISGVVLGKMGLEKHLIQDIVGVQTDINTREYKNLQSRVKFGIDEAFSIIKKIWAWILISIAIGAIIHNYVPQEIIHGIIAKTGWFAVPVAVILGVPMYGSCAAIVPIAFVLFQKGVPIGTALAFMMAVAALSLPEAIILRRAMKLKLIGLFFGITTLSIIFIGYVFNFLQTLLM